MRNKRRMTRGIFFSVCCLVLSLPTLAQTVAKREAESTTKQSLEFGPTGTIHIVDSLGSVKVKGWDKDEVELTVTKKTQKKYEPKNLPKAAKDLERVKVEMQLVSENTLLAINTTFPSRTPARLLRGKTNVNLEYLIKVPRRSTLLIKHDIGEVEVANVAGDIEATSRIGEISLKLPEEQQYSVDARVRLGDVSSEFGPDSQRQGPLSVGAKLTGEPAAPTRRIFLRLGIGDIHVTRLSAEKSGEWNERNSRAYAGPYDVGNNRVYTVNRVGDKLMASVTGNPPQELFPETEMQFFWQNIRGRLIFVKDDKGEVTEVMFDQGITPGHAKRIKDAPAGSGK